jgi:hypothetical protein
LIMIVNCRNVNGFSRGNLPASLVQRVHSQTCGQRTGTHEWRVNALVLAFNG